MRDPRSRLTLTLVALLLGLLVVVQLRAQGGGTGLETRSAQDLTLLVANLSTRNDLLRGEVADLERQLAAIEAARSRGETSADQVRADLARVRMWAGISPVSGAGVRVTLRGKLPGSAVEDLLNELRNAGAEALAVGGVRVVASTVVAGPPGGLSVENQPLAGAIQVEAIGNPSTLTGSLTRAGGVVAQLQATYPDLGVEVAPADLLELPATTRDLQPADAKPRL